jgi:hypothetical protein
VNQGLTLLQRSVLKRLREQGLTPVAEQANRAWLRGQQFAPVNLNGAAWLPKVEHPNAKH